MDHISDKRIFRNVLQYFHLTRAYGSQDINDLIYNGVILEDDIKPEQWDINQTNKAKMLVHCIWMF